VPGTTSPPWAPWLVNITKHRSAAMLLCCCLMTSGCSVRVWGGGGVRVWTWECKCECDLNVPAAQSLANPAGKGAVQRACSLVLLGCD
jgi:hypothetical protein